MADEIENAILTDALKPAEIQVDGQVVKKRPLDELIEADRYLAQKTGATKKGFGLRFQKLVPPGTV